MFLRGQGFLFTVYNKGRGKLRWARTIMHAWQKSISLYLACKLRAVNKSILEKNQVRVQKWMWVPSLTYGCCGGISPSNYHSDFSGIKKKLLWSFIIVRKKYDISVPFTAGADMLRWYSRGIRIIIGILLRDPTKTLNVFEYLHLPSVKQSRHLFLIETIKASKVTSTWNRYCPITHG